MLLPITWRTPKDDALEAIEKRQQLILERQEEILRKLADIELRLPPKRTPKNANSYSAATEIDFLDWLSSKPHTQRLNSSGRRMYYIMGMTRLSDVLDRYIESPARLHQNIKGLGKKTLAELVGLLKEDNFL